MFDTVLGLPVHVLVVHGVVVLVPLVAVGAVVVSLWPAWRRQGAPVSVLALLATGLAWVATQSGEQLNQRLAQPVEAAEHVAIADSLPWFVLALAVLSLTLGLLARRVGPRSVATLVVAVLVVAGAGVTAWRTVLVGHSGSSAVWGGIVENTPAP